MRITRISASQGRVRCAALGIIVLLTAIAAFMAAHRISRGQAMAATRLEASNRAKAAAGLIVSEMQKFRFLPLVLSDYPDVQDALEHPSAAATARLNARLELIAARTSAAVVYIVDLNGRTIASSNWRLPSSFVGQNYGFRPYFRRSLENGTAEQFALGTVSRRPGLYLARRTAKGRGVVVVKIEFDRIEASWANTLAPTIVRDANGVVIMASDPGWRLHASRRLSGSALAAARTAKLYGNNAPPPLAPALVIGDASGIVTDREGHRYAPATVPVPVSGWSLTALEPLEPALAAATAWTWIAALAAALVVVITIGLAVRSREAKAMRMAARRELELQVALRTAELREANQQLVRESRERERNEARLRTAREELAQSNRLATLGQISAGVAHEINQPLTALRTFAENAKIMIGEQRLGDAAENLAHIVSLSERIGDITGELRTFARRPAKGPVRLGEAIDGAMLLMGDRLKQFGVAVERTNQADHCIVAADRVRIEQILINLLHNATDAIATTPKPTVSIASSVQGASVEVVIGDNGPGIPARRRRDLFKSFASEKPDGLGLGLVISRNLAREVGGELTFEPTRRAEGATFLLRMKLA